MYVCEGLGAGLSSKQNAESFLLVEIKHSPDLTSLGVRLA